MKKITVLLILLCTLNAYSQQSKSSTSKSSTSKSSTSKSSTSKPLNINCTDFIDNPEKFIGKKVIFSVSYSSYNNGGLGLRESDSNYEGMLPFSEFGISPVEGYHLRRLDCDGTFIIQIPTEIHSKLPNVKDGYIAILGIVTGRKRITLLNAVRN